MGKLLRFLAVIIVLFRSSVAMVYGQNDFCSAKNTSFNAGEKLTFHVYYNMSFIWINAGAAHFNTTLEDVNGHKDFHIIGDGKTASSYEWFFKVNDRYETYINAETMSPDRFVRNVQEGSTRIHQDVLFDHKNGVATSDKKNYIIPKCTQDVLSAIYFARNIDYNKYNPGDKIPFNMFLDNQLYQLYIKYMGKEEIETKMGKYRAIKIVPLLISGTIFSGGEKMIVWVSDDANHLPLRVESPILVGSIKVDLMDYANLRNPFTSQISKK